MSRNLGLPKNAEGQGLKPLKVSQIGYGAWPLSYDERPPEEEAIAIHLSIAGRRCAPARHFENCLACEGSELASVCAAEPERCRARAAAITKGDERKRAVVQCVGPSLK